MDRLFSLIKQCSRCNILSKTRSQVVAEDVAPKSNLVFLGEAPGQEEDRAGVPFVGRSGKLLRSTVNELKRERFSDIREIYLNIVKCRPPNNRRPTKIEVENCSSWLVLQLDTLKTQVVCGLGRSVLESVMPDKKGESILSMSGKFFQINGRSYLFTFHPSFILRSGGKSGAFYNLFKDSLSTAFRKVHQNIDR